MKKITLITMVLLLLVSATARAGILRADNIYASGTVYTYTGIVSAGGTGQTMLLSLTDTIYQVGHYNLTGTWSGFNFSASRTSDQAAIQYALNPCALWSSGTHLFRMYDCDGTPAQIFEVDTSGNLYASGSVYIDDGSAVDFGTTTIQPGLLLGSLNTLDVTNAALITRFGDVSTASAPSTISYADCVTQGGNCYGTFQVLEGNFAGGLAASAIYVEESSLTAGLYAGKTGYNAELSLKDSGDNEYVNMSGTPGANTIQLGVSGGATASVTIDNKLTVNGTMSTTGVSVFASDSLKVDNLQVVVSDSTSQTECVQYGRDLANVNPNASTTITFTCNYLFNPAIVISPDRNTTCWWGSPRTANTTALRCAATSTVNWISMGWSK